MSPSCNCFKKENGTKEIENSCQEISEIVQVVLNGGLNYEGVEKGANKSQFGKGKYIVFT
jgi:hypothetical protein